MQCTFSSDSSTSFYSPCAKLTERTRCKPRYSGTLSLCTWTFVNRNPVIQHFHLPTPSIYSHKLRRTNSGAISGLDCISNVSILRSPKQAQTVLYRRIILLNYVSDIAFFYYWTVLGAFVTELLTMETLGFTVPLSPHELLKGIFIKSDIRKLYAY